jgi:hypothetical protein
LRNADSRHKKALASLENRKPVLTTAKSVSVYHASAWVALKGPWRRACARVGGRKGDGLSGCDPDASISKRRVQDQDDRHGRPQPSTPKKFWEAGKGLQGRPLCDDADTGTRSRGERCVAGNLGKQLAVVFRVAVVLALICSRGVCQLEGRLEYVKYMGSGSFSAVSVYHASAWVALKGPWRHARARVGGR